MIACGQHDGKDSVAEEIRATYNDNEINVPELLCLCARVSIITTLPFLITIKYQDLYW
jgi:hypothetical protein